MNVSHVFILRPIATSLMTVGLVCVGLVAYAFLPLAALPKIDYPTIEVSAALPGASAETMATSVAAPLERQLSLISGVTELTSSSSLGQTGITIQFDLDRDINVAAQDVQTAISAAGGELPKDLPNPPTYEKVNPGDFTILSFAVTSNTLSIAKVDDYADNYVAQRLSRILGVGLVDLNGEQKQAIRIRLNPESVAALGLSLEDIRSVIGQATLDAPKGTLENERRTVTLNASDQMFDARAYNDLIVAYRDGAPIRIGDIGVAFDSVEDIHKAAWAQGERTVIVDVHKQPGFNVVETVDRVKAQLPQILRSLPPSVHVKVVGDRTQTIRASVNEVKRTLLLTVALVVAVVFLFLRRFWATVIPGITIPVSIIGTFGAMQLLGYSIDNLSLMALVIAVGFVVDDAIIMVENIVRHLEAGETPVSAALVGARQIGFTVVSMTLSLIAVFIPVLLMGGIVGRLFHEFAATLSIAVIISAVISLTLTPSLSAIFLTRDQRSAASKAPGFFDWALKGYERSLIVVLRHRRATLAVTVAALAATILCYIEMPKGFFPQQDTGLIIGTTDAAQDISYAAMAERHQELMRLVMSDPDVENVYGWIGPDPSENAGRVVINLKPFDQRQTGARKIIARLRKRIAGLSGISLSMQPRQDIRVGARLGRSLYLYTLEDPDLAELYKWAPIMTDKLKTVRELEDVDTDLKVSSPQAIVTIDRDTASRLGVSAQMIDAILYDAFGQRQVATIYTQLNQYKVVMEVDPAHKLDTAALETLYVPSSTSGAQVPLSAFTRLDASVVPITIDHQDQLPAVDISFALAPGVALGDAVAAIQRAEREVRKPAGLDASFQGTAQAFRGSLDSEPYLILAAILAVYIVLGVLYESYVHPLTILSTLPSAGLGALLALRICGYDLDIMGLIGIILLIGIVKKNAIMMIDFAIQAEADLGLPPDRAIFEAAILRFRPIMMTTLAALFGALPLALGQGAGAELRAPLGVAIVGGLLISQILTLYTTPVIYLYLDRVRRRSGAQLRGRPVADRL
ncbi:MAG: Acriflavine resistance protein [Rhodospirillales bacterium]|nr:Acriflavine resistance protein [Rhodospirillales bacterium]